MLRPPNLRRHSIMSITSHSQVHPGALVSIILKADQSTGRQVQGTVGDILTKHDHPQGIEVLLTDGRVGACTRGPPRRNRSAALLHTVTVTAAQQGRPSGSRELAGPYNIPQRTRSLAFTAQHDTRPSRSTELASSHILSQWTTPSPACAAQHDTRPARSAELASPHKLSQRTSILTSQKAQSRSRSPELASAYELPERPFTNIRTAPASTFTLR